MGIEIERKFLVTDRSWHTSDLKGVQIKQGYLKNSHESVVRIRVAGEKGFITVKGTMEDSLCRSEFEYEIPVQDALEMLGMCQKPLVEKVRYYLNFMGFEWAIDLFEGENCGLVVAEIEIETENQIFEKPPWAGDEVTYDSRYLNSNLIKKPFNLW